MTEKKHTCLRVRGADRCVKVDPDDAERAAEHSWHLHHGYPATTRGSGRKAQKLYLHRFVLSGVKAPVVDHINGDPLDNRKANLRPADKSQNGANVGPNSRNQSRVKGVVRRGAKWRAFIHAEGRTQALGSFDTQAEAACAYDRAAVKTFGDRARLNGACPVSKARKRGR